MDKHITVIGINFYPEESATGLYSTQMAEYLSQTYQVDVITGFPYYPEWEIAEEYRKKPVFMTEKKNSITIHRYRQYVPKNPTFKTRTLHLLDFTLGSIRNLFRVKQSDLVICIVPFTSSILLGLLLAKLRGAKVWVHIQDFEFDAAIESGLAGEEKGFKTKIFNLLFQLEKTLLDKANIVSTISHAMIEKLKSKTRTKNYFFPNWVDETFIDPMKAGQHALLRSAKFKILYSGSIGAKQDWDFFIRIAEYFTENDNIEFIVVGAGAKKEWLVQNTKKLKNVRHASPVAYNILPDLLCSADLHILFQKNNVLDTVMPSKLLGMMASAKPSLVTGNTASEVARVFERSKGGYFYDSNDFDHAVKTIEHLSSDKSSCAETGQNARDYVIQYYSATKVLTAFGEKVKEMIRD
ncbi:glycosyl transferase family 1 [Sulfurovum lithotrophicum]|uniref:Glycosyl transferase family 1 n=1 Tax=Sulfurovum lithotrophicum TaxID=206403 RepID=A0A7U4LZZ7_9BACT|nr:WcaI family glycosyltransferase [Sulfurovum lithotrophicum]AKF24354.1 glycosyl transferase family 1 [Sulfurovum lithotrophicum]